MAGSAGSSTTAGHPNVGGANTTGGVPVEQAGSDGQPQAGEPNAGGAGSVELDDRAPSCGALSKTACLGESCCKTLPVPGCSGCAFPAGETSSVSPFQLDKYEVTVGRFRAFVNAYNGPPALGAGAHPHVADSGWQQTWGGKVAQAALLARKKSFIDCGALPVKRATLLLATFAGRGERT